MSVRERLTLAGSANGDSPHGARTVLVVDDYPAVLAWASRAFARAGWTVLTATDGRDALDRWHTAREDGTPVRVLVTDLNLPDWGGAGLVARLRAEDADLPVLALHAGEGDVVTWHASLMNRTAFFQKPVRAAILIETAAALVASCDQVASARGDDVCPVEPRRGEESAAR
ncbi:MAG TPA: response regulator [Gemmatimonadaceae bacterium]|nr:response regulator [Gemmatimonadaceae bacterium]